MNARWRKLQERLARMRVPKADFSIISNNCWGAHVYQILRLEYATPFVGLFLTPGSYVRLLAEFPKILSQPLEFKDASDEEWVNRYRASEGNPWPIGILGNGIEIHFMHYKSPAEAREKWNRRSARLASRPERWFFKFCDRDGGTSGHFEFFEQLPYRNKVFFTTRQNCALHCAVKIPLQDPCVPNGRILSEISPAYFDAARWINGGDGRVGRLGRRFSCV
jgi:uncharacterized protein (DUF1919 family)